MSADSDALLLNATLCPQADGQGASRLLPRPLPRLRPANPAEIPHNPSEFIRNPSDSDASLLNVTLCPQVDAKP